jgi:glycosyltransferase involved in cell wall biosynthesis
MVRGQVSDVESSGLVSVTVPTLNSGRSLAAALASVEGQSYKSIELIVIDGGSNDDTSRIAKRFGARVEVRRSSLLDARCAGAVMANGEFILLLDSDQVLKRETIERAVTMLEHEPREMLVLEEAPIRVDTVVGKLSKIEKEWLHRRSDPTKPISGGLLARFYRRELLLRAIDAIPPEVVAVTGALDHAIIHFEAARLSPNCGVLRDALLHSEPDSIFELVKKQFRWGKSARALARTDRYPEILQGTKLKLDGKTSRIPAELLFIGTLKGLAFRAGFLIG